MRIRLKEGKQRELILSAKGNATWKEQALAQGGEAAVGSRVMGVQQRIEVTAGRAGFRMHRAEGEKCLRMRSSRHDPRIEEGVVVVIRIEHALHGPAAERDCVDQIGRVDVFESGHGEHGVEDDRIIPRPMRSGSQLHGSIV